MSRRELRLSYRWGDIICTGCGRAALRLHRIFARPGKRVRVRVPDRYPLKLGDADKRQSAPATWIEWSKSYRIAGELSSCSAQPRHELLEAIQVGAEPGYSQAKVTANVKMLNTQVLGAVQVNNPDRILIDILIELNFMTSFTDTESEQIL